MVQTKIKQVYVEVVHVKKEACQLESYLISDVASHQNQIHLLYSIVGLNTEVFDDCINVFVDLEVRDIDCRGFGHFSLVLNW